MARGGEGGEVDWSRGATAFLSDSAASKKSWNRDQPHSRYDDFAAKPACCEALVHKEAPSARRRRRESTASDGMRGLRPNWNGSQATRS